MYIHPLMLWLSAFYYALNVTLGVLAPLLPLSKVPADSILHIVPSMYTKARGVPYSFELGLPSFA